MRRSMQYGNLASSIYGENEELMNSSSLEMTVAIYYSTWCLSNLLFAFIRLRITIEAQIKVSYGKGAV